MRQVLTIIGSPLVTLAMAANVFADCGCGGGKLKSDPKTEISTKA